MALDQSALACFGSHVMRFANVAACSDRGGGSGGETTSDTFRWNRKPLRF